MFDVADALRGGVEDPGHAWRFVRSFAAEWVGVPLTEEHGSRAEELDAAERELGFVLPSCVRAGFLLLGSRDDLTRNQDPLVRPAGLFVDDGVLVFRRENQDCAFWGIPLDEVEQDDPPVVVQSPDGWIPFLDRMSTAWVELVLSETLFADAAPGRGPHDACEPPLSSLPALEAAFTRVDLPDYPMWVGPDDSPVRWYAGPGCLLRRDGVEDLSWLYVRGCTDEATEGIRRSIPGRWERGS
ncbi:SMI1/KNR4 family protein [Streptomyces sp. NPDC017966]|uniref:SMI1/KNR4 family protein n=1 Tax=unclassified Streptomyces TaxID=2593676 RepID=UPI00345672AB